MPSPSKGTGLVLDLARVEDMGAPTPGIKTTSVDQIADAPKGQSPDWTSTT
ncbi:MAG: hypothetical protein ACLQVK_07765 [Acidimicrobiales bacterium]